MTNLKALAAAALVAATVGAAPAQAVITTFAQYQAIGTGANIYFKNGAANNVSSKNGALYTISAANSTVPGSRTVSFSFLQPALSSLVNNVNAIYTLSATVTNTPAISFGGFLIQQNLTGSFSFISAQAIQVGNTVYASGSNLLSATFTGASIFGQRLGTSGSFTSDVASITYTSDFLTFDNTLDRDFALSLTGITSPLQATPTNGTPINALRTFRARSTGSFSSDPAPVVNGVPEPEMWALMVVGFGLVGLQLRRRTTASAITA